MVTFRRFASVTSLFTVLALGTSAVAFAAPDAAPAAEAGARHHHGHHGRGDLLHASLRLDSLTSAQRQQIEALAEQEKAAHANVGVARSALVQAVAGELATGRIEEVALTHDVQAVEAAIQADEPGDRAALEKLHAILTPAQRVEFVTRIESHQGKHRPTPHGAAGTPRGEGRDGGIWGHALNLTDGQKQQIRANLKGASPAVERTVWEQARDTHAQMLEAFKGDQFVMNQVAPPRDPRLIEAEAGRIVRMAKASAPVLTAEQRATAAAKLREIAARPNAGR